MTGGEEMAKMGADCCLEEWFKWVQQCAIHSIRDAAALRSNGCIYDNMNGIVYPERPRLSSGLMTRGSRALASSWEPSMGTLQNFPTSFCSGAPPWKNPCRNGPKRSPHSPGGSLFFFVTNYLSPDRPTFTRCHI